MTFSIFSYVSAVISFTIDLHRFTRPDSSQSLLSPFRAKQSAVVRNCLLAHRGMLWGNAWVRDSLTQTLFKHVSCMHFPGFCVMLGRRNNLSVGLTPNWFRVMCTWSASNCGHYISALLGFWLSFDGSSHRTGMHQDQQESGLQRLDFTYQRGIGTTISSYFFWNQAIFLVILHARSLLYLEHHLR